MAEFLKPDIAHDQSDVDSNVGKQPRVRGLVAMFNSKSRKSTVKHKKTIKKKETNEMQNAEIGKEKLGNRRSHNIKRLFGLGRSNAVDLTDTGRKNEKVIKQATLDGLTPLKIHNSTSGTLTEGILGTTEEHLTREGNTDLAPHDDVIVPAISDDVTIPAISDDVTIPAVSDDVSQHEIIQQLNQKINRLTEANRKLSQEKESLSTELEKTKNELTIVRNSSLQTQSTIDETEEDRDIVTSLKRISQSFDDHKILCPDESTQTKNKLQKAHSEL